MPLLLRRFLLSLHDKINNVITYKPWLSALICGALSPLGFAPFDVWLLSLVTIAIFAKAIISCHSGKSFFYTAMAFAIGYYGIGVSWIFISIHYFGSAHFLLAGLLTGIFILFVAGVFALPFYSLIWIKPSLRLLIGVPAIWVLSEWIRTWIFTGFPWLLMGYTHTDTWLSGWAPIGGVLLMSLWSLLSSCVLSSFINTPYSLKQTSALISGIMLLWFGGYGLQQIAWTQPADITSNNSSSNAITVGLVQPNIPQDLRWTPEYQSIIKERLLLLSEPLWENDWIIWPEGVIPNVYHRSTDFINETKALAEEHNTTVITGVLYDEQPGLSEETQVSSNRTNNRTKYYNSIIGIGNSEGIYHKRRLVPFGEYVPLENWIRGLIDFFDLPFSVISSGPSQQNNLRIGQYTLANAICYEIAYPALVAKQAVDANVLLTVSNDAWFGESIGPIQHFQMVRMRALEVGRYIIRGTNNGISAIIDPQGNITVASEQFVMTKAQGHVIPMTGTTPYMMWQNYLILAILVLLFVFGVNLKANTKTRKND